MSNIEDIIRAKQVQEEALAEIDTKIQECNESMQNYENLSTRITTLPDKLSHSVMVPFGKLAFMPGKLVHTNELLVHLGDAYFASMTCKQAMQIVELRQKNLQDTLSDLEKVSNNFEKKSQYLGDIRDAVEGDEFEIKEDYPGPYTHPKDSRRISRIKNDKSETKNKQDSLNENTEPQETLKSDEFSNLMSKLDELEKQEENEDELYRLSDEEIPSTSSSDDEDYSDSDDSSSVEDSSPYPKSSSSKHVRFKDQLEESERAEDSPQSCTIRFQHSKVQPKEGHIDMTPADVHKLIQPYSKSILKPSGDPDQEIVTQQTYTDKTKQVAVANIVTERNHHIEDTLLVSTPASKPISRFKAGRKKFT